MFPVNIVYYLVQLHQEKDNLRDEALKLGEQ